MTAQVEFHFDFGSPNAYLSHCVIPEIERRTGARFAYVPVLLGDVVVCPEVAQRNADDRGMNPDDEIALLVVHGVLHVLGHDHAGIDDTARMKAREHALLEEHHRR